MLRAAAFSAAVLLPATLAAQAPGRWPPDSLLNLRVIPRSTPVVNVIGIMRNFASELGVRCQHCHLGEEGMPLERFDFASDERREKRVAREMLRMVQAINGEYLARVPERPEPALEVTCGTCHRGVPRPVELFSLLVDIAMRVDVDSAVRAYHGLRARYYGRASYDFGEPALNIAAFRLARQNRFPDAMRLLALNEEQYPGSSNLYVFRGNIELMRGDTTAAANAFREALRRDAAAGEARFRLQQIGRRP